MKNLKSFETSALIDMLSMQMAEYYRLSENGVNTEGSEKCFLNIKALQQEIEERRKTLSFTATRTDDVLPGQPLKEESSK